jgi:hypothetical protein
MMSFLPLNIIVVFATQILTLSCSNFDIWLFNSRLISMGMHPVVLNLNQIIGSGSF